MPTHPDSATVERIVDRMVRARRLLFVTGAGISADSGLPTYRGIGGLYDNRLTEDRLPIETALSGAMLRANPAVTWKYLAQIERTCRGARFNEAHGAIAAWQGLFDICVLTQNIDGFHRDAGSRNVIEIHGDLHDLACTRCSYRTRVPDYAGLEVPPLCPRCRGPVRPLVVLFGESLPTDAVDRLYRELHRGFDLVFTVGTTSVFPYIAGPVLHARRTGVATVEINPGETEVSRFVDYKLAAGAAASLCAIGEALGARVPGDAGQPLP